MSTLAELLAQSLTALRSAKRFSAASQSYRKDNPAEYAKVIAYLDGGARPTGVTTEMGKHAVLEEDARRALAVTPPPPPGVPIDSLAQFSRIFGKWFGTVGSGAQEALSTSPPFSAWASITPDPSVTEVSTVKGAGFRIRSNVEMVASWDAGAKAVLAAIDQGSLLGTTEDYTMWLMFPSSGNSGFASFPTGVLWEWHTASASGHHLALEPSGGGARFRIGIHTGVGNSYLFYSGQQVVLDAWVKFRAHVKWSSLGDGFVRFYLDDVLVADYSGATIHGGQSPYAMQFGYYGVKAFDNEVYFADIRKA